VGPSQLKLDCAQLGLEARSGARVSSNVNGTTACTSHVCGRTGARQIIEGSTEYGACSWAICGWTWNSGLSLTVASWAIAAEPKMNIDPTARANCKDCPDIARNVVLRGGGTQQAPGTPHDHADDHKTGQRIEPEPAGVKYDQADNNHTCRDNGVRHHVQERAANVEVAFAAGSKQPGGHAVNDDADARHDHDGATRERGSTTSPAARPYCRHGRRPVCSLRDVACACPRALRPRRRLPDLKSSTPGNVRDDLAAHVVPEERETGFVFHGAKRLKRHLAPADASKGCQVWVSRLSGQSFKRRGRS
jgi:hypothetical protein